VLGAEGADPDADVPADLPEKEGFFDGKAWFVVIVVLLIAGILLGILYFKKKGKGEEHKSGEKPAQHQGHSHQHQKPKQ